MALIARRSFLTGLGALVAAPAIVRAVNLMPVRGVVLPPPFDPFKRPALLDVHPVVVLPAVLADMQAAINTRRNLMLRNVGERLFDGFFTYIPALSAEGFDVD